MKLTRYTLAFLGLVLVGMLAACGSDDNDNNNCIPDQFGNCIGGTGTISNTNGCQLLSNGQCQSTIAGIQCIPNGNTCTPINNGGIVGGNGIGAYGGLCRLVDDGRCVSTHPSGYCYFDSGYGGYYGGSGYGSGGGRCRFSSYKATQ